MKIEERNELLIISAQMGRKLMVNRQQSEQRTEDHHHEREQQHRSSRERRLPAWARADTSAPTSAFSFTDFAPKDKDIRDLSEQENLQEEKEKPVRTAPRKSDGRTEKR